MPQESAYTRKTSSPAEEQDQIQFESAPQDAVQDLDDILNDIESVLETNAEEYVNGFVQKGGQ